MKVLNSTPNTVLLGVTVARRDVEDEILGRDAERVLPLTVKLKTDRAADGFEVGLVRSELSWRTKRI